MKILFLHGLGQSKKAWNQTIKQLNCEDVKCLDVISNKLDNPSFNYLADQLEMKLIEEQNPIIICGLSLGAVLGFELYFRHPEKISGLVLIAPQYKIPTILLDVQNFIFRLMPNKFFPKTGTSKNNMISISSSMRNLDYSDKIKRISCPVYIVCGNKDKANMKATIKLNQLLPESSLHLVCNAKHEVNIDKPYELADIINKAYDEILNLKYSFN